MQSNKQIFANINQFEIETMDSFAIIYKRFFCMYRSCLKGLKCDNIYILIISINVKVDNYSKKAVYPLYVNSSVVVYCGFDRS